MGISSAPPTLSKRAVRLLRRRDFNNSPNMHDWFRPSDKCIERGVSPQATSPLLFVTRTGAQTIAQGDGASSEARKRPRDAT